MTDKAAPALASALLLAISLWPAPGRAEIATAAGWQADCAAYIAILSGTGGGDDLDITYCLGQTLGIVAGFETGSRIGALSMASLMTVLLNLDAASVFELFEKTDTEALLGYCVTEQPSGSRYIMIVADYLNRHPDKGDLPVTAVFFEALQEAFPCAGEAAGATEGGEGAGEEDNDK